MADRQQYIYPASTDVNGGTVTIILFLARVVNKAVFQLILVSGRAASGQVYKRCWKSMLNRSELYLKAQRPVGKRWTSWPPMDRIGILAFFEQLREDRGLVARLDRDCLAPKEVGSKRASNEVIELEDDHFGTVRLERRPGLHEKKRGDVPNEAVRISVHLEGELYCFCQAF